MRNDENVETNWSERKTVFEHSVSLTNGTHGGCERPQLLVNRADPSPSGLALRSKFLVSATGQLHSTICLDFSFTLFALPGTMTGNVS